MTRAALIRAAVVGGLMLTSALALAQQAPESLLPPGFDTPPPPSRTRPPPSRARATPATEPTSRAARSPRARTPAPAPSPSASPPPPPSSSAPARTIAAPVVQSLPLAPQGARAGRVVAPTPGQLPSIEALEAMSPDQLSAVLGQAGAVDATLTTAGRALTQAGVIDETEGGLPQGSLAAQDASLVRAAIVGNRGRLVSRWGHILLRRALASRLTAPMGMDPADFAAIRAALLVRMGEGDAARALVQDIDPAEYTPALSDAAFDAYVSTADFTGICPLIAARPGGRADPPWQVADAICAAFRGDGGALARLDRALSRGLMPRIDILLAQKYAGAAGKARRAVTIEWDGVDDMTPWRYGLTLATGLTPPDRLMRGIAWTYADTAALAPMLGLAARAAAADQAGADGVLSSVAMVDLYGQIYATDDVTGDWSDRSGTLRDAYVAETLAARVAAMRSLWSDVDTPAARYARLVLTAYAAARIPTGDAFADDADDLVAAMLAAGLDANAALWSATVKSGGLAWAQLVLAAPQPLGGVDGRAIQGFASGDRSPRQRKSGFLLAGLAGLGRIPIDTANDQARRLDVGLGGRTHWIQLIDRAAQTGNPELVALLAGVGMQGDGWDRMTPRFLYHIVSALRRVGLEPEARMIAAEAVARG